MKFASFRIGGRSSWGIVDGGEIIDIGAALSGRYDSLKSAIAAGALASLSPDGERYKLGAIEWLPVIPDPDKIICVGLNYETHRKETGRSEVEHPTIFTRFANSQCGHLANIIQPRVSTDLDYEGELAVVIGKPGRYISKADAFAHVAGYACYNDGSVRDWQRHTHQFTPGKNFPATGAFWPLSRDAGRSGRTGRLAASDPRQRHGRAGCADRADDFRYPAPDRILFGLHAARAWRRHRDGHAGRPSAPNANRRCGSSPATPSRSRSTVLVCYATMLRRTFLVRLSRPAGDFHARLKTLRRAYRARGTSGPKSRRPPLSGRGGGERAGRADPDQSVGRRNGIETLIVERNLTTVQEPRAVSIDDESLRTMQAAGLAGVVSAKLVPGYGSHYFTPGGLCFLPRSSRPECPTATHAAMRFASLFSNSSCAMASDDFRGLSLILAGS